MRYTNRRLTLSLMLLGNYDNAFGFSKSYYRQKIVVSVIRRWYVCRFQWRQDYTSALHVTTFWINFLYFLRGRGSMVRWCDLNWSILSLLLWLETLFLKYTFLPNDDRLSIDAAYVLLYTRTTRVCVQNFAAVYRAVPEYIGRVQTLRQF